MNRKVRIVVPEAPTIQAAAAGSQRKLTLENLRIGILDNGKANADHLLRFVAEGLEAALPVKSVVALRKGIVGMAAPPAFLNQLTEEADFVVSAMAE